MARGVWVRLRLLCREPGGVPSGFFSGVVALVFSALLSVEACISFGVWPLAEPALLLVLLFSLN